MLDVKPHNHKLPVILLIPIVILLLVGWYCLRSWPIRFHGTLDDFFGNGNWQTVSEETKDSIIFKRWNALTKREQEGTFHEWNIAFENQAGETEVWTISDHTLKINHKENWFPLDAERYTARQALGQELLWIALDVAGEEVRTETLGTILPEEELDCLAVDISFLDGLPDGGVYDRLLEEPWFNVRDANADRFLQSNQYDFYVDVFAHDYRVDDLSEAEQSHLYHSLGAIEQALQNTYGAQVDYEIYLGEGYQAESVKTNN